MNNETDISRLYTCWLLTERRYKFMKQIVLLMVSLFFVVSMPLVGEAGNVNISIGIAPPPLEFAGPPDVIVVPSGTTYVYMVPDMIGLYFYHSYWYRFHDRRWYRSTIYSGPWTYIETSIVPGVIVNVPPDYFRYVPRGYHRIHYRDLYRSWRTWDNNRHWNRYDWYKHELREHERRRTDLRRPPKSDLRRPPLVVPHQQKGQDRQQGVQKKRQQQKQNLLQQEQR
jgi:hypothetical protein